MSIKNRIYGFTLVGVMALATLAAAQDSSQQPQTPGPRRHWGAMAGPGGAGFGTRGMGGFFARGLNLTDAQKTQAKAIFQNASQAAQPLMQQLKANHQAITQAVENNQTANIQALANTQGQLVSQLAVIRANAFSQFYSLLTPDQQATLKNQQASHSQKHGRPAAQPGQ